LHFGTQAVFAGTKSSFLRAQSHEYPKFPGFDESREYEHASGSHEHLYSYIGLSRDELKIISRDHTKIIFTLKSLILTPTIFKFRKRFFGKQLV